jgi:16S rRNA pseudouridine516 synthase
MRRGLFPAGRLDKDTTGFVLITDDGEFAHRILSPKNHIDKTYVVSLRDNIEEEAVSLLENGITLRDGTNFLPSKIKILSDKECEITICEGKYHQIKRMFWKMAKSL